jgi:hypothetical protein
LTQLGYPEEVRLALDSGLAHGRDFGILSMPLLIAGLAAVIAFIPKEQRQKVREIEHIQPDGSRRRLIRNGPPRRVLLAAITLVCPAILCPAVPQRETVTPGANRHPSLPCLLEKTRRPSTLRFHLANVICRETPHNHPWLDACARQRI